MSSVFKNAKCTGSLTVLGQTTLQNLVVSGTTTSVNSENVMLADNYLYLNKGYTTVSAQSGGFVVNYLPTATATTVDTGGFTSSTEVSTVGAATFSAGDIVQFNGTTGGLNDGLFVVSTHAANVLTLDGAPTVKFANTTFTVEATSTGATITKVNVASLQVSTGGALQFGAGATQSGLSFTDLVTDGSVFALLAGRSGGQTLNGGTVSGQGLTLVPNSADLTGKVSVSGTDASSSTSTGALTVAGGVGVTGAVFAGSLRSNTVDASSASTLSVGTTTATAVTISRTGVTTTVADLLNASNGLAVTGTASATSKFQAPLFDTATAVPMDVGTSNATLVTLGSSTTGTTIAGKTTFGNNVVETVAALSGASIAAAGLKALNTLTHTSNFVVLLPSAPTSGTRYRFINISTNSCDITRSGSDTIEGSTTFTLGSQFDRTQLTYISGTWYTGL